MIFRYINVIKQSTELSVETSTADNVEISTVDEIKEGDFVVEIKNDGKLFHQLNLFARQRVFSILKPDYYNKIEDYEDDMAIVEKINKSD